MTSIVLIVSCIDKDTAKKIKLLFNKKWVSFIPTRTTVFSIIRSPHVFNKSHEQFKLKKYKLVVTIPMSIGSAFDGKSLCNIPMFSFLLTKLGELPDTEIRIKIKTVI